MKTKTSELIGPALDWAVAKCESYAWAVYDHALYNEHTIMPARPSEYLRDYNFDAGFVPSTDWSQGGPIIERERITLDFYCDPDESRAALGYAVYDAEGEYVPNSDHEQTGPTPLVAAMRCYVASKLGDEIDIPKELL